MPEQCSGIDAECVGQLIDIEKRNVALTSLNSADVGAMYASPGCERFLGEPEFPPHGSNPPPERDQDFLAHAGARSGQ